MDNKIAVTLECFVRRGDGKYLMLKRGEHKKIMPGVWMAPGGHKDPGEGLFECARREILEETGLKIKNLELVAVGDAVLEDLEQELFFSFIKADYAGGELKENTDHDGELVWLTPEEILKQPTLLAELREVFPQIVKWGGRVISYKVRYAKGNELISLIWEEDE